MGPVQGVAQLIKVPHGGHRPLRRQAGGQPLGGQGLGVVLQVGGELGLGQFPGGLPPDGGAHPGAEGFKGEI